MLAQINALILPIIKQIRGRLKSAIRAYERLGDGSSLTRCRREMEPNLWFRSLLDSPLEGDGFELPVPGRIYSAAMRSQVISRCSSLSPVRRGGGMRTMRSLSKRTPRTLSLPIRVGSDAASTRVTQCEPDIILYRGPFKWK